MRKFTEADLGNLWKPESPSHKGQNGRVLVIGGSKLFHASIFWAADVASRLVDLVHFTSPAMENNDLVRVKAKEKLWSGIVVPWEKVEEYVGEDDCVLIGPGMSRSEGLMEGERPTGEVVNGLLAKFPDRRWVVDGGALQEGDPKWLNASYIITPHKGEWEGLIEKMQNEKIKMQNDSLKSKNYEDLEELADLVARVSRELRGVTILVKGVVDVVARGDETVVVEGGNEGMTKGGTGDVLAGLTAAFYAKNGGLLAAAAAAFVNKKAGESLYERVGPNFNAGDLVAEVPRVLKELLG